MGLREYWRKRDFAVTPEPRGAEVPDEPAGAEERTFIIQKHAASHLHYDFRLELEGVLKSWSVPKGPSLDPEVKRLAMHTEDHPLEYGDFEGIIPKGQYGGGTVLLWERGTWVPLENPHKGYHAGKLKFLLRGEKLRGGFTLVRTRGRDDDDEGRSWLLIKENDAEARPTKEYNVVEARPESVATGRQLDEIAAAKDRVWHSNRAEKPPKQGRGAVRRGERVDDGWARVAGQVEGAREAVMPAKVRPQLPRHLPASKSKAAARKSGTAAGKAKAAAGKAKAAAGKAKAAAEVPDGAGWLHEIQYDGCRTMARIEDGHVRLLDEKGKEIAGRFEHIAAALAKLGLTTALLDGEVTVLRRDGTTAPPPSSDRAAPGEGEVVYFVFDLLYLEGHDLTASPLSARKQALARLLGASQRGAGPLRYSDHIEGSWEEVLRNGCQLSLKGIVSKRSDAPYAPGRGPGWVRASCGAAPGEEQEEPARGRGERAATKTKKTTKKRAAPAEGGRRKDDEGVSVAGVRLSHPDRVLYPEQGITKRELALYYASIAERMVPHVQDRPLTLVRCPEGTESECVYMKHGRAWGPSALRRVMIQEKTKTGEYLVADSAEALVSLAQMGILEIHTWNSTVSRLEQPDRVVFDLDPDPSVPWERVVAAALLLRERLEELDLESFVKTTGGKGFHVVVPLAPSSGWDECLAFTKALSGEIARREPEAYTIAVSKAQRKGKIFIDYLRNTRGATSVAAYSTRARPGAPVSAPLSWDELGPELRSDHVTIRNLPQRLASLKADPWARYGKVRQKITAAMRRAVGIVRGSA
ncbi:ATP-dependent DNA ligase [Sorangium cellulosum]|uniref:ATP-dependent DNA ligase n=1 Tax=Sorangium cellulosum TaxID=56 RepID=A0A2L0EMZ0_SORCE|nr:non-homologous end-joining DNA ligase [Sorangium cellulosum]AUX40622.1 ATP-dependent DNA ligase [Sorangium cellulosum]